MEQSCAASCVYGLSCDELSATVKMWMQTSDPNAPVYAEPPPRIEAARCCVAACLGWYPTGFPSPLLERCQAWLDRDPFTSPPPISQ